MLKKLKLILIFLVLFYSPAYAFDGYGVCLTPDNAFEEEMMPRVFELLEGIDVKWVRSGFRWSEIEPIEGKYVFEKYDSLAGLSRKHDIKILGVIVRTPKWASINKDTISPPQDVNSWKRFVKEVVTRYKEKVTHWEIWNEPDSKKFWKGTPDEYIILLKEAYRIIKTIDPKMTVVSAGLDGSGENYIGKLLDLGLASNCDAIGFHPYGITPEKALERVKTMAGILKKHNVDKPLWLTEIGWQAGGWPGGPGVVKDEETKAQYLKKTYDLLKPHAKMIFWYRAIEAPRMYGLIENNKGNLKKLPAYDAFKEVALSPDEDRK